MQLFAYNIPFGIQVSPFGALACIEIAVGVQVAASLGVFAPFKIRFGIRVAAFEALAAC